MKRTFRLCLSAAILLMAALATASCTDAVAPLTDDPTDVPATTPDEDLTGKPIRIGSVISLPATTGADTEASGEAGTQGSAETRIIPPDSNFPKEGSTMTVFCFVPTNASNGEEVSPAAHANYTYNGTSWQPTNPDAPLCWQHSTQRHFFAAVSPAVDDTEVEFGAKAKGLGENTAIDEEGNEYICTMIFDPAFNLPTEWTDERYTAWGRVRSTAIGGACVYGEAPKADAQISLTLCRPLVRINIISESAQVTLRNAPAATSSTASLSDPVTLTMRMLSGGEWVHNAYTLPYSNSDIEGTTDISFTTDTEANKSTVANKGLRAGGKVMINGQEDKVSVVTNKKGGLEEALKTTDTSKKKIVIGGTINDTDISALKGFIKNNSITDVAIVAEGVTSIGDAAFLDCTNLTSISLPDGVTSIETFAFGNCSSLESINLPEEITNIGESAFFSCASLKSISLPEGMTSINRQLFANCTSLENISLPKRIMSIGINAFRSCTSMESISLPDGVTSIGGSAFQDCTSLEEISLSGINDQYEFALPKLGSNAFTGTKLITLYLRDIPEAIFNANKSTYSTWGDISWKAILYDYNDTGSDLDGANYKGYWVPNP